MESSDYHWLVTVALVTSSVIAVTANAFLLLVFARRRGLRTVPNRFVINLLVTNLLSSLLLIPLLLVDQDFFSNSFNTNVTPTNNVNFNIVNQTVENLVEDVFIEEGNSGVKLIEKREKLVFEDVENVEVFKTSKENVNNNGELLCYFAQASTSFVCTASIFSILLIGINQYFGVIHSLRYHFYINKCRSTIFIASSWIVAFFCAILSTLTYSDSSLWHFCPQRSQEQSTTKIFNTIYAFSYFFVVILAPFVAICIIYLCIYTAAHQNSERMRKSTSAASNAPLESIMVSVDDNAKLKNSSLPKVHSAPNISSLKEKDNAIVKEIVIPVQVKRTCSDRNSFITNLKHKISNASVFRYREETRAAKISVLVIFMVLICYVPYGLTLVLSSACINISPGQIFNYLSLVLLVFSNVISPFLFGYRNKRIKREIGKFFGLVPKSRHQIDIENYRRQTIIPRNKSFNVVHNAQVENAQPLLNHAVPQVIVTCKVEVEKERKSILKRVGSQWSSYKKCNFITVPDSCLGDARGSFSSASTQISNDE